MQSLLDAALDLPAAERDEFLRRSCGGDEELRDEVTQLLNACDAAATFLETPASEGPYGARGVGEPPVVAIAGAIGNAIRAATGALVTAMPMTPDRVYEALRRRDAPQ